MDDERLDFAAIDPAVDRLRWERMIRSVLLRARPELARRRTDSSVLGLVGNWVWPTLSAAAVAAILSGAALALTHGPTEPAAPGGVVQALGVAEPVASWLTEERAPGRADFVALLIGDVQ